MLRRGDRGSGVAAVRSALASLGYLPLGATPGAMSRPQPDDTVFDAEIDRAVRAFQQQRGLIVDGIVGPATTRSLTDARWTLGDRTLSYTLSAPMSGDDIYALQVRLSEMGYDTGRPDGVFGPSTDNGVRAFQRDRGIIPDGVFGTETFRELSWMRPKAHRRTPGLPPRAPHRSAVRTSPAGQAGSSSTRPTAGRTAAG